MQLESEGAMQLEQESALPARRVWSGLSYRASHQFPPLLIQCHAHDYMGAGWGVERLDPERGSPTSIFPNIPLTQRTHTAIWIAEKAFTENGERKKASGERGSSTQYVDFWEEAFQHDLLPAVIPCCCYLLSSCTSPLVA